MVERCAWLASLVFSPAVSSSSVQYPTHKPTLAPSQGPSPAPTPMPSKTYRPTAVPSPDPLLPTPGPSPSPSTVPAPAPSSVPIPAPTLAPVPVPTLLPIPSPTLRPSLAAVPSPDPTSALRVRIRLTRHVVVTYSGRTTAPLTADDDVLFRNAVAAVIGEVANPQQVTVLGTASARRRRLSTQGQGQGQGGSRSLLQVDVDIEFELNFVSDVTNVDRVVARVSEQLVVAFTATAAAPLTPFGDALAASSTALALTNNAAVEEPKSALALAGAPLVLVLPEDVYTAPPTPTPSLEPTPQPSVAAFGAISAEAVEVVATVTAVAVGAAVGSAVASSVASSVGSSVASSAGTSTAGSVVSTGGAGGGAAAGGTGGSSVSGSSNPGGDPLSMILLVQGIAITRSIATMPDSYTDAFADQFAMFNLQMTPPAWARDWLLGLSESAPTWLFGPSAASTLFANHFFYAISTILGIVVAHAASLAALKVAGKLRGSEMKPPSFGEFPQVEIKGECGVVIGVGSKQENLPFRSMFASVGVVQT